MFCLIILSLTFAYSQTTVKSDCDVKLDNIFKAYNLKIKYETVQYIYNAKALPKNDLFLNNSFELIRGISYFEKKQDITPEIKSGELENVEWMSKEEMDLYIERLNCTPDDAYKEYEVFLQNIQLEKEMYLKCIDMELVKGDESEYAKDEIFYSFKHPWTSLLPPKITKLDFLKVFKEYILIDEKREMPDSVRAFAFLNCGCKIPPFVSLSPTKNKKQ
ncbi:hypothetical protein D7D25_09970 [Proteiniphilum sp. X52]|nr:hypothetical protein D7D25_09970 [Proteiniphilum sp. X52]